MLATMEITDRAMDGEVGGGGDADAEADDGDDRKLYD